MQIQRPQKQTQLLSQNGKTFCTCRDLAVTSDDIISRGQLDTQSPVKAPPLLNQGVCLCLCVCVCGVDSPIDGPELRVRQQASNMAEPWTGATSHTDQHVLEHRCIMCVLVMLLRYSCVTDCISSKLWRSYGRGRWY